MSFRKTILDSISELSNVVSVTSSTTYLTSTQWTFLESKCAFLENNLVVSVIKCIDKYYTFKKSHETLTYLEMFQ